MKKHTFLKIIVVCSSIRYQFTSFIELFFKHVFLHFSSVFPAFFLCFSAVNRSDRILKSLTTEKSGFILHALHSVFRFQIFSSEFYSDHGKQWQKHVIVKSQNRKSLIERWFTLRLWSGNKLDLMRIRPCLHWSLLFWKRTKCCIKICFFREAI